MRHPSWIDRTLVVVLMSPWTSVPAVRLRRLEFSEAPQPSLNSFDVSCRFDLTHDPFSSCVISMAGVPPAVNGEL